MFPISQKSWDISTYRVFIYKKIYHPANNFILIMNNIHQHYKYILFEFFRNKAYSRREKSEIMRRQRQINREKWAQVNEDADGWCSWSCCSWWWWDASPGTVHRASSPTRVKARSFSDWRKARKHQLVSIFKIMLLLFC